MGALACKYCNFDQESNNEGKFEQINNNNPILITNKTDKNNYENDVLNINDIIPDLNDKEKNKENNFKNINLKIRKEKETIDKQDLNNNKDNNNIIIKQDEVFFIEEINENNKENSNLKYNLKKNNINHFSITNKAQAKVKVKNYELNKIKFGLKSEDKKNMNQEQEKLYKEAEINLQQFSAPSGAEISKLQTIMSNILLKLNKFFTNINLTSSNDDYKYILLNSNLKKMINYEINAHKTTMYSERFCVLYPKMLKYYKSKEQFLKNLSPLCVLPINQISNINIAKPINSKNKIYHLIICNKIGIQKNFNNSIFLNIFDSCEINEYISTPDANESLLILTSDDEKNIFQWYIVIQYLIEISKI